MRFPTATAPLHRIGAGSAVLALCAATILVGAGTAGAQPTAQPAPSGGLTFSPTSGDQQSFFEITTAGPCDVAGADGFNSVVAGPGRFAPGATEGSPDGRIFSDIRLLTEVNPDDPRIRFGNRLSFQDLAAEAQGPLLPGDYVVTLRCIDVFLGTIFQTYQGTLTFATNPAGGFIITASGQSPSPSTSTSASPTVSPSVTPTVSPSVTPTVSPSVSPTVSPSVTPGGSPTPSGSPGPTLRPSTSPTPVATPTPTPAPNSSGGSLAFTGAPVFMLMVAGLGLTTAGAGLLVGRRRRGGRR